MAEAELAGKKLMFITTSLGTKWESYSQTLIELGYPTSKRVVLDGTRKWSPLMFLEPALATDSHYTIHIDEDCFLLDPAQLDRLISYMDQHDEAVLAGVPDGGTYYREHNPYACNLFFVVFKTRELRELLANNPDWMNCRFRERFKNSADLDIESLDQTRIRYDDYEPYYGLFWAILESGRRIIYLNSRLNPALLSTDVHLEGESKAMARHMWYLRSWNATELGPNDKIPHRIRYAELEQEIINEYGGDPRFRRVLREQNFGRAMKHAIRTVSGVPDRLMNRWQGLRSTRHSNE